MSRISRPLAALSAAVLALALVPAGPAAASAPRSSTTLTLSTTESAYGQSVTASAQVASAGGQPQGDVVFAVDDLRIKANLGAGGGATVVLPRLLVGTHAVAATYVPQFPGEQSGSSSPTAGWVVAPARSHLQVQVAGRRTRVPTTVRLRARRRLRHPSDRPRAGRPPPGGRGPCRPGGGACGLHRRGRGPPRPPARRWLPRRGDLRRGQPAPAYAGGRAVPRPARVIPGAAP